MWTRKALRRPAWRGQRGEEAQDLARHIESARNYFSDDDIVVIGDTECVRDDRNQLEEFTAERVLDFGTGDVDAFASGRAGYGRVMVPVDQPEFSRARHYSILEAESQKAERAFSDHFVLLGPIEVEADDD